MSMKTITSGNGCDITYYFSKQIHHKTYFTVLIDIMKFHIVIPKNNFSSWSVLQRPALRQRPLLRSSGGLLASEAETRSSHCLHNFMSHEKGHCFTGSAKKQPQLYLTHTLYLPCKRQPHQLATIYPCDVMTKNVPPFCEATQGGYTFVTISSQK